MRPYFRYICILSLLCVAIAAKAQMVLTLDNMTRLTSTTWKYGTVSCTGGTNNVTSIILSMVNNDMTVANPGGISPTRTLYSDGYNPRTVLYLFSPAIPVAQVKPFIENMVFTQTNTVPGANPFVEISVDANPVLLPAGAPTITAWNHPDGTPHYYVWVNTNSYIGYMEAYNAAKGFYFQGMRGYLPTITSAAENSLLTNISPLGGWSAGARTTSTAIADQRSIGLQPPSGGNIFKWLCGPETGIEYYRGPTWNTSGAGPIGGAYSGWPASGQPDGSGTGENSMQINYGGYWNDLPAAPNSHGTNVLTGYFIEFGGSENPYTVGGRTYPGNPKYKIPTAPTTDDQWHGFSPGNRARSETTFKANEMRSNVLIIE